VNAVLSRLSRGAPKLVMMFLLQPSTIFKSTLRVDCSLRSLSSFHSSISLIRTSSSRLYLSLAMHDLSGVE
jgi:hypothetical protein